MNNNTVAFTYLQIQHHAYITLIFSTNDYFSMMHSEITRNRCPPEALPTLHEAVIFRLCADGNNPTSSFSKRKEM